MTRLVTLPTMNGVLHRVLHQLMRKECQNHPYKVAAGALDVHLRKGGNDALSYKKGFIHYDYLVAAVSARNLSDPPAMPAQTVEEGPSIEELQEHESDEHGPYGVGKTAARNVDPGNAGKETAASSCNVERKTAIRSLFPRKCAPDGLGTSLQSDVGFC